MIATRLLLLLLAGSLAALVRHHNTVGRSSLSLEHALQQVQDAGFRVCVPEHMDLAYNGDHLPLAVFGDIPSCLVVDSTLFDEALTPHLNHQPQQQRWLHETDNLLLDETATDSSSGYAIWINAFCALVCITVAALAAGLTLGLLGLDPLMLLIKERAATAPEERQAAATILPMVQQHHRLVRIMMCILY